MRAYGKIQQLYVDDSPYWEPIFEAEGPVEDVLGALHSELARALARDEFGAYDVTVYRIQEEA